jgi:hypothetical protein
VYDGRVEHNNRTEFWLEQIRIYGGNSPVLFFINKRDSHVPEIAQKTLQKDYPNILGYHMFDIGDDDKSSLIEFRRLVMDTVSGNPSWNSQIIHAGTYRIKKSLRKNFDNLKTDYITREAFNAIAAKQDISPEETTLALEDLHALGICLWYNDETMGDYGTLVLNPEWITNGIYKIINWGNNNGKHLLSLDDSEDIFADEELRRRYPKDKVGFLFKLMRVYELAFIPEENKLFAPLLLPLDRPDSLNEFHLNGHLKMVFSVEKALPPNIVSRLIVLRNKDIKDEKKLWRKGAVLFFKDGGASARIIEDERSIEVVVIGEDKTSYLVQLRETLKQIFDSYKELYPKLEYEVLLPEGFVSEQIDLRRVNNDTRLMLTDETIADYIQMNAPYIFNHQRLPLQPTANGYGLKIEIQTANFYSPVSLKNQDDHSNHSDNSTHMTFNIHDCVICFQDLQGKMNNLASAFKKQGLNDEAEEIIDMADTFDKAEKILKDASTQQEAESGLRKKGILGNLVDFGNELIDEQSNLNKKAKKFSSGVKKVQDVLKVYNDIAKLFPMLPQVPDLFLNAANK